MEQANVAVDHVDRDADDLEHILPAELIEELERQLAAAGRLPASREVLPRSPHALSEPQPDIGHDHTRTALCRPES
jgi:hypothetical protein